MIPKWNRSYIFLLLITAIGFFLRFYHLDFNSLWLDESFTFNYSQRDIIEIWSTMTIGEFNPPLFYWIEHYVLLLGHSEIIVRLVPAIAGALTIPVGWFIGKELKNERLGLFIAGLFAVSPFHIFYSQDARAYTLMLLFISLAIYFYIKLIKYEFKFHDFELFAIFSIFAVYTHFYSLLVTVPLLCFLIWKTKNSYKTIFYEICLFFGPMIPLLLVMANLFILRTSSAPTYGVRGFDIVISTIMTVVGNNLFMLVIFLMFFITGLVKYYSSTKDKYHFIPVILFVFGISVFLSDKIPMLPRYLIIILPLMFIPLAYSAFISKNKELSKIVMVFLILCFTLTTIPYYTNYSKEDWRGFSSELSTVTKPGDTIVVMPGYMKVPLDYYYSNITDQTFEYTATNLSEATPYKGNNTLYVITGDIFAADTSGQIVSWLKDNTRLKFERTGIYVFV